MTISTKPGILMRLVDTFQKAIFITAARLGTMINSDKFKDWLLLLITKIATKKFFRESIKTKSFAENLAAVDVTLPKIAGINEYSFTANTLDGEMATGLKILRWAGPEAPTLIYHQGGGEIPYDYTLSKMYPKESSDKDAAHSPHSLNILVVQAPCQATRDEVRDAYPHLRTYVAMMAVPVAITEKLIKTVFNKAPVVAVAGYSLGGFVTCRHHLAFNSADIYLPFMCGTRHAEIFLTTVHSGDDVKRNQGYFRQILNFEQEWLETEHSNVFPVLGEFDLLNRLDTHLPSYGDTPVEVWQGGHLYGVNNPDKIRNKIEQHMREFLAANGKADAWPAANTPQT